MSGLGLRVDFVVIDDISGSLDTEKEKFKAFQDYLTKLACAVYNISESELNNEVRQPIISVPEMKLLPPHIP